MTDAEMMATLARVGAIITNSHVVYTSGRHGTAYVNKDALYLHPTATAALCAQMAASYDPAMVDVVAGPTVGGVILAQWVAWHLSQRDPTHEVLAVYAEEASEGETKRRIFRRGYDQQVAGKRVIVVEDIVTTGGSARLVIDAVRALGGTVVGLSVLCNRSGQPPKELFDVPLHALTTIPLDSWAADECPMCAARLPINTTVGKGATFVAGSSR
ncbi:MAG: phosphoribosyltransferase [Ktedonobacterales bacterium]|nr:phosphoribosyltransferase [Ktedonobacterales bacterium]